MEVVYPNMLPLKSLSKPLGEQLGLNKSKNEANSGMPIMSNQNFFTSDSRSYNPPVPIYM